MKHYFGILSGISADDLHDTFLAYLLTFFLDLSGISSDTLSGVSSDILAGVSSDILAGISSDILSDFFLASLLTFTLTFYLACLYDIHSGISSDILPGISPDILSGDLSGWRILHIF